MLLSDLIERNAQTNARGLATLFRNRSHTWAQFALRSAKLAQGLRGLGVLPGDRVAILAHNSDRYTEFFFAVAHAGAGVRADEHAAGGSRNRLLARGFGKPGAVRG